jgi:hypothetical protein
VSRIRTIKPDFWTDDAVTECSVSARLLFIGMWNFADDRGNLERSAKQIKARVFPVDAIDCEPLILQLMKHRLLVEYAAGGKKYLHIRGFTKHQVINRPSLGGCPVYEPSMRTPEGLTEPSVSAHTGSEGIGRDSEGSRKGSAEGEQPVPPPAPELTLQPSAPAAPPASAPKKASPAKKTLLPENFELTGKRLDTAIRLLPEDCDYLAEFEKFKAHHTAKGSVMVNWDAAWSYWCSNAKNHPNYARKPKPTLKDSADARRKAGWWQPGDPTGREDLA